MRPTVPGAIMRMRHIEEGSLPRPPQLAALGARAGR